MTAQPTPTQPETPTLFNRALTLATQATTAGLWSDEMAMELLREASDGRLTDDTLKFFEDRIAEKLIEKKLAQL